MEVKLKPVSLEEINELTKPHRESSRYLRFLVNTFFWHTSQIHYPSGLSRDRSNPPYFMGVGTHIHEADMFSNWNQSKVVIVSDVPAEGVTASLKLLLTKTPYEGFLGIYPHLSLDQLKDKTYSESHTLRDRLDQQMSFFVHRLKRGGEDFQPSLPERGFDYEDAVFSILQFCDSEDQANDALDKIIKTQIWAYGLMGKLLQGIHRLRPIEFVSE